MFSRAKRVRARSTAWQPAFGAVWMLRKSGGAERRLMRPEEVMNDLRDNVQIILPKKGRPVLAGRAIYFRREAMRQRVGSNRFAKP